MIKLNSPSLPNLKNKLRAFHKAPLPIAAAAEIQKAKEWLQISDSSLFIEVGCGVGMHPILWSKANPNARLLAFERTKEKYTKAERRFQNHQSPQNICIVHGDAAVLLPYLVAPNTIEGFFFLYPNPYPKSRHANLRLAHSPFLNFVVDCLKANGTLTLATNEHAYAEEVEQLLPLQGLQLEKRQVLELNAVPRTHFEKKYLARGECCYDLLFKVLKN